MTRSSNRVVTSDAIASVEVLMKDNPFVTVNEIYLRFDVLQFNKVSLKQVPPAECRIECLTYYNYEDLIRLLAAKCDGYQYQNSAGNETWVHYHQFVNNKTRKVVVRAPHQNRKNSANDHLKERFYRLF